jgi:hypothetical protein
VRSQRDLHLLRSIAQLALHRRNLHNCLHSYSGFGFWISDGPKDTKPEPRTEGKQALRHSHCKQGADYLGWVTERIFIHHIPGCENSGSWSQSINASLKSTCGNCKANSICSKVYNLHSTRAFQD